MQNAYELAAKIFQFHRKTNILHSVLTLKSRIQVMIEHYQFGKSTLNRWPSPSTN
ncbi:MAG: hypothetical protein OFPII_16720 [Osedax symbiont Rs1]|nr:MAG: hypothetical protein OFPII_16720 [Osedax symbiont Rs1]